MDPTRDSARPPQDAHMQPPAGLHPMLLSTEAGFSTMPMGFWNDSPMQTGPLGNPTETPLGLPPPHQQHFSQQHFSQQHFPQQQTSQELQTNPPFAPQRSSSPEPQVGRQGRRKGQHPGLDEESTMMVTDSNPNFLGMAIPDVHILLVFICCTKIPAPFSFRANSTDANLNCLFY